MTIEELKSKITEAGTELEFEKERIKTVQSQQKRRLAEILEQLNEAKEALRIIEELRKTHIGKWLSIKGGFLFCMDVDLSDNVDEIVVCGLRLQINSPDKLISLDNFRYGDCNPFYLTKTEMVCGNKDIQDSIVTKEIVRAAVEKQLYIARKWYDDVMDLSFEYAAHKEMLEQPIEVLELPPYLINRLRWLEIYKLKDFLHLPDGGLNGIRGWGPKMQGIILDKLAEKGLGDLCHAVRFGVKLIENI